MKRRTPTQIAAQRVLRHNKLHPAYDWCAYCREEIEYGAPRVPTEKRGRSKIVRYAHALCWEKRHQPQPVKSIWELLSDPSFGPSFILDQLTEEQKRAAMRAFDAKAQELWMERLQALTNEQEVVEMKRRYVTQRSHAEEYSRGAQFARNTLKRHGSKIGAQELEDYLKNYCQAEGDPFDRGIKSVLDALRGVG